MVLVDLPDADTCYAAALSRDARFDGRFVMGVTSTGIYCLPSCPVRKPKRANCRFYPGAAAAAAAGFRPCRRCRPDAAPGSRHRDPAGDVIARALALIEEGYVDRVGVAGLARAVHVSERQLHHLLVTQVGASAKDLARVRRVRTAKALLEQTELPMTVVARAAGFGSVRSFNDTVAGDLQLTPSQVRAAFARPVAARAVPATAVPGTAVRLVLRHREPFAVGPLRKVLAVHAVPGVECDDEQGHRRVIPAPGGPAVVTVHWAEREPGALPVTLEPADLRDVAAVVAAVRRWLDLDATPARIAADLAGDDLLDPLLDSNPGLRLPGASDGDELAFMTVLAQQVSLRAARTWGGRLVALLGEPVRDSLVAFPTAAEIAAAGAERLQAELRLNGGRARGLVSLAEAIAGGLKLNPGADRAATREQLLALPGIGPWTADYIELRALGNPDVFMPTDLVARKALGGMSPASARRRAERWAPWRGYALMHLWTKQYYDV